MSEPVLSIEGLSVRFAGQRGDNLAVDRLSLRVERGQTVAIVGESGCGKSAALMSILRLLPAGSARVDGSVRLEGRELTSLSEREMRKVRGRDVSIVFQDPMASLNPVLTVGRQLRETIQLHQGLGRAKAVRRALELLDRVGISEPARRIKDYPHQLSGGMRQRVMIAMALSCNPRLIIADEPTTALDVTIQAQILDLIKDIQVRTGTAVLLVTHDLGVVAEVATHVIVMYAGRKVEEAPVADLFRFPLHPYSRGLIGAVPKLGSSLSGSASRLVDIPGQVPMLRQDTVGCIFTDRCQFATEICRRITPTLEELRHSHRVACHHPLTQELAA